MTTEGLQLLQTWKYGRAGSIRFQWCLVTQGDVSRSRVLCVVWMPKEAELKRQALKARHGWGESRCLIVLTAYVGLAGNPPWLGGKIHEMAGSCAGICNVYPCSLSDDASCQDTDRRLLMGELVEVKSSMKEQQGTFRGDLYCIE